MPPNTGGPFLPLKRSEESRKVKVRNKTICGRKMQANTGGSFLLLNQRKKEKNYINRRRKEQISEEDTSKYRRFTSLKSFCWGLFLSHNPLQNVYLPQAITILYRCSAVYASNQQIQATVDIAIFSELTILTILYNNIYPK